MIENVVLQGFGNGTVGGTLPLVVTRGYAIGEEAPFSASFERLAKNRRFESTVKNRVFERFLKSR